MMGFLHFYMRYSQPLLIRTSIQIRQLCLHVVHRDLERARS